MADEPLFPKGQGASPGVAVPESAPVDDGGAPLAPVEPPSADGFGVETTFSVTEVTPGEFVVVEPTITGDPVTVELIQGAVVNQLYPGATLGTPVPWTDLDTRLARCVAPRSGRVGGLFIHATQMPTGLSRIDIGLYDDNANLLAHSGRIPFHALPEPLTGSSWQRYEFITPRTVLAGELLKWGYYADIDTGSFLFTPVILPEPVRSTFLNGVSTVEQFAKEETQVRLAGGVPPTELVDDPYLVYGIAAHADTPWTMFYYL